MRLLLLCLPWHGLHLPSLALSTLTPLARRHPSVERVDVRYVNLEWAEHLRVLTGGRFDSTEYRAIAESEGTAIGEWVFSGALHRQPAPEFSRYHPHLADTPFDTGTAEAMYRAAIPFVDRLADEICAAGYDVIGITTMFVQNIASLAVAQAVTERAPEVTVILGGANCDDDQGAALHRNYPYIDYVVRGEAEVAFPALLDVLAGRAGAVPGDIAGLCWRDGATSVANPMPPTGVDLNAVPEPVYDEFFDAFARASVCATVRPRIIMEAARGCWWGQKHHCTFCGLNDMIMPFRAKEPDRVFDELCRAVEKHQVLDVFFADNIIDQRYLKDLLPRVEALGWDLRIFFETKSNQVYSQLAQLARAGVSQLQPGIESFSTPVLQRMRKGVAGWQNVRFLRDCRTLGIDPLWNLLYGFPGETDEDYTPMVAQLPHLVHLRPPMGVTRLELTRFSPYFTDHSLGLANLGPAPMYADIYGLPDTELADLVYVLRSPWVGVSGVLVDRMKSYVDTWTARGVGPSLAAFAEGDRLVLVDERDHSRSVEYRLTAPAAAVYAALLKGRSRSALLAMMTRLPDGLPAEQVGELLDAWETAGLVFRDDDIYVALATGLAYA